MIQRFVMHLIATENESNVMDPKSHTNLWSTKLMETYIPFCLEMGEKVVFAL